MMWHMNLCACAVRMCRNNLHKINVLKCHGVMKRSVRWTSFIWPLFGILNMFLIHVVVKENIRACLKVYFADQEGMF